MRRGPAVAAAVVVNAAVQAAIVAIAPRDPFSAVGVLLALLSLVVLVGASIVIARGAVLWTLVGALLVVLSELMLPYATPVAVALAAAVTVAGSPRAALARARRHPVRTILLLLLTAVVVLLGWVAALLFGLLFGGVPGSAATWLLAGALAALVSALWARSVGLEPAGSAARQG
ncbi:hypothetical protein BH11ACT4_BH11ACT4_25290 [soil metagenome]